MTMTNPPSSCCWSSFLCLQSRRAPVSPKGEEPASRANAASALARRGSDKALDERVKETLLEMLDEQQQFRNFIVKDEKGAVRKDKNGKEIPDVNGARLTVIATLQALTELHRRRPELDLAGFQPAIEKLARSDNLAVSTEAKKTQQLIELK